MNRHFLEKRLGKLQNAFSAFHCDISGNPASPLIVINGNKLLHYRIDDHVLHFVDKVNHKAPPIRSSNIDGLEIQSNFLSDLLEHGHFTTVYLIKVKGVDLFIAGFDHKIREGKDIALEKYPVFGRHKLRYFFSREQAEEAVAECEGYSLEIV